MRLLNTTTLNLEDFFDKDIPEYAILSHRWGKEEVSFQELRSDSETMKSKAGYTKIKNFCVLAKNNGFNYGWVDTCSIDKSSSAELSEAINSMFRWYSSAQICYAYLEDVEQAHCWDDGGSNTFAKSLWFTRGWTLQELLAPAAVEFYAEDWAKLGEKQELSAEIADITLIDRSAIEGFEASNFSVAQIMSWAAMRITTRREDEAYCLMGLLGVHMPLLYGEGANAFRRLQEEVIRTSADQSILAWTLELSEYPYRISETMTRSPLAISPRQFADAGEIVSYPDDDLDGNFGSMALVNKGLQISLPVVQSGLYDVHAVLACRYRDSSNGPIGIALLRQGTNYTRFYHKRVVVPLHSVATAPRKSIRIDPQIPTPSSFNGSPSGFVVSWSSSLRSSRIRPISAYPSELWNSHSQTLNFPNLDSADCAESKHFALTLSDGKQSAIFLLGFRNTEVSYHGLNGAKVIRSKNYEVWCDIAEAATEDDIKRVWELSSGPEDGVWNYGLEVTRIGWQATWTVSILPQRLLGESVWAVTFDKSDLPEGPSKEDVFCRINRVESFPTLRLRSV